MYKRVYWYRCEYYAWRQYCIFVRYISGCLSLSPFNYLFPSCVYIVHAIISMIILLKHFFLKRRMYYKLNAISNTDILWLQKTVYWFLSLSYTENRQTSGCSVSKNRIKSKSFFLQNKPGINDIMATAVRK